MCNLQLTKTLELQLLYVFHNVSESKGFQRGVGTHPKLNTHLVVLKRCSLGVCVSFLKQGFVSEIQDSSSST